MNFVTANVVVNGNMVTLDILEQNGYISDIPGEFSIEVNQFIFRTSHTPEIGSEEVYLKGVSKQKKAVCTFSSPSRAIGYATDLTIALKKLNKVIEENDDIIIYNSINE